MLLWVWTMVSEGAFVFFQPLISGGSILLEIAISANPPAHARLVLAHALRLLPQKPHFAFLLFVCECRQHHHSFFAQHHQETHIPLMQNKDHDLTPSKPHASPIKFKDSTTMVS